MALKPPIVTEENGLLRIDFLGEVIFKIGEDHWLCESWSEDEAHHAVDSDEWTCSCRGWECRKYCRHIEAVRQILRAHPEWGKSANADRFDVSPYSS